MQTYFFKLAYRLLKYWWRWSRGLTLGVQGVVIDEAGRVLLIEHGYRPGWHFPGGGVEFNERVEIALARELKEETGVIMTGPPEFFGIYANFAAFPGDHVLLYKIPDWEQPMIPSPTAEITRQRFFALDELPDAIAAGTRRRIDELFRGAPRSPDW